ncbi:MAG: ABC transporter ATP-binding protein [Desulfovibrionaceae bacterium]
MIDIRDFVVRFPGFTLGPVSLHVPKGTFFALMGPTGSGKTLLLETVAGLCAPHEGAVRLGGMDMTHAPPEQRRVGLVYQDHALFPHMTVLRNITYGQRYHGIAPREGERHAHALMDMLGLAHLATRMPAHLSGGEKQRIALARALACSPDIVLLDEPLSSLDPQFREGLRANLKALHRRTGVTFFMVTHDFVDALTLADRSAVIRAGQIEQVGTTQDIFQRPATPFIADFVGMKNIFPATVADGQCCFAGIATTVGHMTDTTSGRPMADGGGMDGGASDRYGMTGHAALRPEDVLISRNGAFGGGWVSVTGTVGAISRQGFSWTATVRCDDATFTARLEHRQALDPAIAEGAPVTLGFDPAAVHFIRNAAS